jgi:microcystin degradation protein MlrC
MTRVAIAGFQHETNTFAPIPTEYNDFSLGGAWPGLTRGEAVIDVFRDLNIPIGGFIQASPHWQLVPVLWTAAEPSGYVSSEAFETIVEMICSGICDAGQLDAVYLDLHGAMVIENFEDGEGEVVRRVRDTVGPNVPIAVSLDLHGNLFPDFFALSDVVTIYRTYPHLDMADTGRRCQRLLQQRIEHGPLAKAFRQLDYLIPLTAQATMREPAQSIYANLESAETSDVLSADIAMGFPPADIEHCGVSVVCYGGSQQQCDAMADALLLQLKNAEREFINPMQPAEQAVEQAIRIAGSVNKPVVIADPQDNPGAGGSGDSTGLLHALISANAADVWVGMVWDESAAAQAHDVGVGGVFAATVGGRFSDGDSKNAPVEVEVEVETLTDGEFMFTGPMYGGAHARLGKMALLRIADTDIHVIVSSIRTQNADAEIFRHMGVEPAQKSILVVKSTVHFLADYTPMAETIIFAEADGLNPCVVEQIPYTRLREGVRLGACGPIFDGG